MYLRRLSLVLFLLQCLLFTQAQRGIHADPPDAEPEPPIPEIPEGPEPQSPAKQPGGSNIHPGEPIPGNPVGAEPNASDDDEKIDIKEIGEKLKDLIDDISSLIDVVKSSSTSTSTSTDDSGNQYTTTVVNVTTETTSRPFPSLGADCTSAQSAYAICYNPTTSAGSSSSATATATANFTALAPTQQAACLCNASPDIDFNAIMKSCYDWTNAQQNKTGNDKSLSSQFASYASAIANGTALCATPTLNPSCKGLSPLDQVACQEGGGSSNPASSPSTTPAPTGAPASPTSPSTGGSGRAVLGFGTGGRLDSWYLIPIAASVMLAFANAFG